MSTAESSTTESSTTPSSTTSTTSWTRDVLDVPIARLDGTAATARAIVGDKVALVVNVASRCGLTPQYAGLERLQERFGESGLTVVGVPCNQFGGQEPGTSEEIETFCSMTYGVTFPLTEKVEVNGPGRHPLYEQLVDVPDERGRTGDVRWNFEKFVVDRAGRVLARFNPQVDPEDAQVVAVLEAALRS
jgi:glutathione peroxidase